MIVNLAKYMIRVYLVRWVLQSSLHRHLLMFDFFKTRYVVVVCNKYENMLLLCIDDNVI